MAWSQGFRLSVFLLLVRVFLLDNNLDWSKLFDMDTSPNKYQGQIAEAWSQLTWYEGLRRAADQRIADCRELIRANANFLPERERKAELLLLGVFKIPTNITEAVRLALFLAMARKERLTPTQLREHIEARGFNLSEYTNPAASISTILRRMKESDPPEAGYDEVTDSYAATNPPGGELVDEAFNRKIVHNTLLRVAKFEKEQAAAVASEETKTLLDKAVERRRLTED